MLGTKQETLAFDLGDNFNQKQFHLPEQKGLMKISSKQLFTIFKRKKKKKESQKFIMEDFKKQVYDKKYDLQGGDFLSYPKDLNLPF